MRKDTNTEYVPCSFGSQVNQSASWHIRHFSLCTQLLSIFLLFLFSCSFLRCGLDHSNGIEWENSALFCIASFQTQRGETDWRSVFLRICVFHCSRSFYYFARYWISMHPAKDMDTESTNHYGAYLWAPCGYAR